MSAARRRTILVLHALGDFSRARRTSIHHARFLERHAPENDYLFHDGFSQGWHHLGGKRALAYARYRYVIGPEGDNFARELRQQQVVSALRGKLQRLSPQSALRFFQAATTLSKATETNLTTGQMVTLYLFAGADNDGTLDCVSQLTHVARP